MGIYGRNTISLIEGTGAKRAVTLMFPAVAVKLHNVDEPEAAQAPPHSTKAKPLEGDAVSDTKLLAGTVKTHDPPLPVIVPANPQLIPALLFSTRPLPVESEDGEIVTLLVGAPNRAVIELGPFTVKLQVAVLETQAPLKSPKVWLPAGVAVSTAVRPIST